ncbi:GGDEF domain-containing protein [Methylobacterium sp. 77]|uniref:GGDEF domain-containing protein n=1 Tax=Methylobacterium sp. 77 TaxID=1101192 RepID=UPI00035C99FE|nr:GGDEF domain-containing protein [Methylobacterium sp. 77]
MALDINTLQFATLSSRGAYLAVFIVVVLRQRHETYLWHWIASILASVLTSLFMMSGPVDGWMPLSRGLVTYCGFGASLALAWSGLRLFYRRPVASSHLLLLAGLPGILYSGALLVGLSPRIALALVFAPCLLIAVLAVYECLWTRAGDHLWSQYIIVAAMIFYSLSFAASLVILVATDLPMRDEAAARIALAVDLVAGILVHFAFLAMSGERASLRLSRLAQTDPLTGLANRRGLIATMNKAWESKRDGKRVGIIMADIDHFKSINDRFGHPGGDDVLIVFAELFAGTLRREDIAVRWGGKEFLAVLPDIGLEQTLAIAERLRLATASHHFQIAGRIVKVTASIGVAMVELNEVDIEPATRRADAAHYAAKSQGRNRVCQSSPGREAGGRDGVDSAAVAGEPLIA